MTKALLIGNSQIVAIRDAANSNKEQLRHDFTFAPIGSGRELLSNFFEIDGEDIVTKSNYYHSIRLPDIKFETVGICAPLYTMGLSLDASLKDYRILGVGEAIPEATLKRQPISTSAIRRASLYIQRHMMGYIEVLLKRGVSIFVIEGPRIFKHHRNIPKIGAEMVIGLDGIFRESISEKLRSLGVKIVSTPENSVDENGFMKEGFGLEKEGDQNHGNVRFGLLQLERIQVLLDGHKKA